MSEIKRCFAALGFKEIPDNPMAVIERAADLIAARKGETESDKLARQTIIENRDMCLEIMEEQK